MRVGLDGSPLKSLKTGVGRYTHELVCALKRHLTGLDLFFYYGTSWSQALMSLEVADIRSVKHGVRNGLKKMLPPIVQTRIKDRVFKTGFRRNKLELFHATNYVAPEFDGPSVVTVYDLSHLRYPETHPARRLGWLATRFESTVQNARHVITISKFSKKEICELLGISSEKISIIYPGVSSDFRPVAGKDLLEKLGKWSLKPKGYLLTVGTLEPRKNLINLIKSFDLLPAAVKECFPLVTVGMSGWKDKSIIQEMKSLTNRGYLIPLGYLSNEDLATIYSGARLFVYLSLYEGFGMPPLEAMACGVPVVVSNRASLPEVVGQAGMLVDADEIDSVATTLESLVGDDGKCHTLGQMGLQQAAKFTWQTCAEKTFSVYQKALSQ